MASEQMVGKPRNGDEPQHSRIVVEGTPCEHHMLMVYPAGDGHLFLEHCSYCGQTRLIEVTK